MSLLSGRTIIIETDAGWPADSLTGVGSWDKNRLPTWIGKVVRYRGVASSSGQRLTPCRPLNCSLELHLSALRRGTKRAGGKKVRLAGELGLLTSAAPGRSFRRCTSTSKAKFYAVVMRKRAETAVRRFAFPDVSSLGRLVLRIALTRLIPCPMLMDKQVVTLR